MKIFNFIKENILLIFTIFLLIFIPLYPKLPLIDVTHTWVYIRVEDFVILLTLLCWFVLLITKRISLKTPLTLPILIFWIIGAVSTIHGILFIFPTISGSFPNVAFLSFLRRIEYLSLFFIAYSATKDRKLIPYIVVVLTVTLLLIVFYGFGQRYLGFPAFLTMNEEVAKGIPLQLSSLSRISSTFGGHYDLAAYLVLIIPILSSMIFGFKNLMIKFVLLITVLLGFVLLFMTVSRSSFFVLLLSLGLLLILQQKKKVVFAIVFLLLIIFPFLSSSTGLIDRFGNTVKEIDVLVSAKKGDTVGQVIQVPVDSFKDKAIKFKFAQSKEDVDSILGDTDNIFATGSSQIIHYSQLPASIPVVIEPNAPTGENLPQGTQYINLPLAPIIDKVNLFFYQKSSGPKLVEMDRVIAFSGNFLIKRVKAYDLSLTTRSQGGWPNAIALFKKDIFFGGGYSTTGLAVDNNYLRILGEVGLIGFISYFSIFLLALIYIKKTLVEVDSQVVRSFVFGFIAGIFGLFLNAILIDVFEASKISYTLWLLTGITIGTLHFYQKGKIDSYEEIKKIVTSELAIIIYLFIIITVGFSGIAKYYFVGDDFTWFRWIADCTSVTSLQCPSLLTTIYNYFTDSSGFFFRPGTKLYFLFMYSGFWLNQTIYHLVSILLHFIFAILLFFLANKIFKRTLLAAGTAFLFVILSGYNEAVYWISSTGYLFNAVFIITSLLLFIAWREKKKIIYLIFSVISIIASLLFHEMGVVTPLLLVAYGLVFQEEKLKLIFRKLDYYFVFLPIPLYLILRYFAQSHWFNGDYSYNLIKLPLNIVGNGFGYLMLTFFGSQSLTVYHSLRNFSKENAIIISLLLLIITAIVIFIMRKIIKKIAKEDQKIIIFSVLFFIISLLPFLGLGNIASRYSYLSSVGLIFLFVVILEKLYEYLIVNGKSIAMLVITLIVSIFSLIHIIQLQTINSDWSRAGDMSRNFLLSLDEIYANSWGNKILNLYLVDVPTRTGDAWVFPVGLGDAAWFVFHSDKIKIYKTLSTTEALNSVENSNTDKVFQFNSDGSLKEVFKGVKSATVSAEKH